LFPYWTFYFIHWVWSSIGEIWDDTGFLFPIKPIVCGSFLGHAWEQWHLFFKSMNLKLLILLNKGMRWDRLDSFSIFLPICSNSVYVIIFSSSFPTVGACSRSKTLSFHLFLFLPTNHSSMWTLLVNNLSNLVASFGTESIMTCKAPPNRW
jgi:hypothetical protein